MLSAQAAPVRKKGVSLTPSEHLARAVVARIPAVRARHARLGLASRAPLDRDTQAMLLRQLYIAYFESRRFGKAYEIASQLLSLRVLVDVAHQDAARAAQALGQSKEALGHLRLAARRGPAARRAFHLWTLGSMLLVLGRFREATGCLERAARWGTVEKPLYIAQAAVARLMQQEAVPDSQVLFERLRKTPLAQGYGRFVLGQLAYFLQRWEEAKKYLEAFIRNTEQGRPGLAIALAGEIAHAQKTLERMQIN